MPEPSICTGMETRLLAQTTMKKHVGRADTSKAIPESFLQVNDATTSIVDTCDVVRDSAGVATMSRYRYSCRGWTSVYICSPPSLPRSCVRVYLFF